MSHLIIFILMVSLGVAIDATPTSYDGQANKHYKFCIFFLSKTVTLESDLRTQKQLFSLYRDKSVQEDFYEALYHYTLVYFFALTDTRQDAEDLSQEAAIRFLEIEKKQRPVNSVAFGDLLKKTLYLCYCKHLGEELPKTKTPRGRLAHIADENSDEAGYRVFFSDLGVDVLRGTERLTTVTPLMIEVAYMYFYMSYTPQEISLLKNIKPHQVYSLREKYVNALRLSIRLNEEERRSTKKSHN